MPPSLMPQESFWAFGVVWPPDASAGVPADEAMTPAPTTVDVCPRGAAWPEMARALAARSRYPSMYRSWHRPTKKL